MSKRPPQVDKGLILSDRLDLGALLRRRWWLPVVLAVVLAIAGAFVAYTHAPTYTASASLSVGTTNVNTSAALGGFAASAPALAGAYSRAVQAEAVVDPVARRLRLSPAAVRGRVIASQVPSTPVIRVDATGPSVQSAVDLANLMSRGLAAYAGDLNASTESSQRILGKYRDAQSRVARKAARRDEIAHRATGSQPSEALIRVEGQLAAAKLEVETLAEAYRTSQVGQGARNPLAVLTRASGASSDRSSRLQLLGLTGLVAGFALGCAIAVALGQRRRVGLWG
jgi:capsular polysaccharide biosynthesis protein